MARGAKRSDFSFSTYLFADELYIEKWRRASRVSAFLAAHTMDIPDWLGRTVGECMISAAPTMACYFLWLAVTAEIRDSCISAGPFGVRRPVYGDNLRLHQSDLLRTSIMVAVALTMNTGYTISSLGSVDLLGEWFLLECAIGIPCGLLAAYLLHRSLEYVRTDSAGPAALTATQISKFDDDVLGFAVKYLDVLDDDHKLPPNMSRKFLTQLRCYCFHTARTGPKVDQIEREYVRRFKNEECHLANDQNRSYGDGDGDDGGSG